MSHLRGLYRAKTGLNAFACPIPRVVAICGGGYKFWGLTRVQVSAKTNAARRELAPARPQVPAAGTGEMSTMMSDLRQAVNKLRALSPQLNSAVGEADRVVALVESFLRQECQLGVEAEVPLKYNEKGKPVTLLRYAAVSGSFRIALTNTDGETRFVTRPWIECDRDEKLVSFAALPKLLIAVAKGVEQQIASTNTTATTVSQILAALGMAAHGQQNELTADGVPELTLLLSQPGDVNGEITPKIVVFPPAPRETEQMQGQIKHRRKEAKPSA
ncbi:MAG: hypothetical protein JWM97_1569 [Phycisphaerales bacterium]|nr:hypothetical protein [Phycisphaerales bacterium]